MTKREHLFLKLIEECSEVQHRVAKLMQFGADEWETPETGSNIDRLQQELRDLTAIVEMLVQAGYLPAPNRDSSDISAKILKVLKYREYSQQLGCVER